MGFVVLAFCDPGEGERGVEKCGKGLLLLALSLEDLLYFRRLVEWCVWCRGVVVGSSELEGRLYVRDAMTQRTGTA